MARFAKKRPLLLILLLLVCTVTLISCGQGNSSSISFPTPTPESTLRPTVCTSCVTLGEPSLKRLGESTDGTHYLLSFVMTNNGNDTLSNFEVNLKVEAQTATTHQSISRISSSSTPVAGHSRFTYQMGDPNVANSGITLPNPPPSSVHVTVTLMLNVTTLASWDGQVNFPA